MCIQFAIMDVLLVILSERDKICLRLNNYTIIKSNKTIKTFEEKYQNKKMF